MATLRSRRRGSCGCARGRIRTLLFAAILGSLIAGCASIPEGRYGVARLAIEGVEQMDEAALRACLATRERPRFGLNLGTTSAPQCGQPPFDGQRLHLRLFSWPWSDWPAYDRSVFERDLERIERWYRARGFYDAHVVSAEFDPPVGAVEDRVMQEESMAPACEPEGEGEGCRMRIRITVEEGERIRVGRVRIRILDELPNRIRQLVEEAMPIEIGDPFDEANHDAAKEAMLRVLREEAYACASLRGRVMVNPGARTAQLDYEIRAGPLAVIGEIGVQGNEDRPARAILGASYLRSGQEYRLQAIEDAQRAIYALGGLSSVELVGSPRRGEGEAASCTGVVDLEIRVSPGRRLRHGLGAGIQSGRPEVTDRDNEGRQWDLHLIAFFEHRNLFGGLRRLRIEDKPKLIFPFAFPEARDPETGVGPRLGNLLSLELRQPAFIEPRTSLVYRGAWDIGPDSNNADIFRHDVDSGVDLERTFLSGRLRLSLGVHGNLFRATDASAEVADPSNRSDYHVLFLQQTLTLDLRDRPARPRQGLYFAITAQEGGLFMPSSWDYLKISAELRGYAPLPWGLVLAARFGMGAMLIGDADGALDDVSRTLGPLRYRLRAGGPNSHRGFVAGSLGDASVATADGGRVNADDGGLRRWLGSIEIRAPLSKDLGFVVFTDMADVNRAPRWRFGHLNIAVGVGLRYQTIVGPLRFDMGFLIPSGAVLGGEDPGAQHRLVDLGFGTYRGALHLTIGEAF